MRLNIASTLSSFIFKFVSYRLSQNYTLGKWMNALESGNISDKHKYLEDYLFSILFVLVAIFSRSILQATINLSAATVTTLTSLLLIKSYLLSGVFVLYNILKFGKLLTFVCF